MCFGISVGDLSLIRDCLSKYKEIDEVLIFGSRATGNYKPGSDVDVALKGNIDSTLLAKISYILNEELPLPYQFDVVGYSLISHQSLTDHIDKFGKPLS
ncbi:MAG: nucleotidyltransferase domain-containing protein [Fibrobacteria bacterium]|nr:nucleotidyltransferase domain-containing protein [Fibrobacteria bacterium]